MSTSHYSGQCVVVFSAASLQQYIFQSNRLKENIGASYLAKSSLNEILIETIRQVRYPVYTNAWNRYEKVTWDAHGNDACLMPHLSETADVNSWRKPVNLIYIGGGNAALLCKNRVIANEVVKVWSRALLKAAPGLRVIIGYGEVKDSLAVAYRAALQDLARCEEALPFGAALGGLPIVRTCTSTGLPASQLSQEPYEPNQWISEPASRKRQVPQNSVTNQINAVLKEGQRFALQPENDLGGGEGQSYVAVVHADGNGMGALLNDVIDADQNDTKFLHNLRAFSASVSHQSLQALMATLCHFQTVLPQLKNDLAVNTSQVFPIRPIVFGGDDLTFVCDGRLGLHLTSYYLREFAKCKIMVLGESKSIDACAGVAIVPTKFPFAQAYGFADELCGLAKTHRRDKNDSEGSWLDFHIVQAGVTSSVAVLRDMKYQSLEGGHKLYNRPYEVLGETTEELQGWNAFVQILQKFQSRHWPRSRAKGLLHALTQGPTATKHFVDGAKWRKMELPRLDGMTETTYTTGWTTLNTTPYFDPLEALDFCIAINGEDTEEVEHA